MAELLDYKCPKCGGALEFDTELQKLKCPFCDSQFEISEVQKQDDVLDKQEADSSNQVENFDWGSGQQWDDNGMSVFVCKSCGGEIVGDSNTAATSCPYCNNPVVMSGRLSGVLKPDCVIPFKLDKNSAKDKLKSYVNSKRFAPSAFKSNNKLEEIKGVYVPFWLFDSNIGANATFEATKEKRWEDSDYEYIETSYYEVYRQGRMSFANIPVDGSTKMPADLMESIEPYDFKDAVDFSTAYLAGYLADKYDISMEQGGIRANERIKTSAENELRKTVKGYDSVTKKFCDVQQFSGLAKYALYPVWLLNTTYNGEKYTFAMNGQTGKFVGNIPVDKGKLTALFAGVTVGVSAALIVIAKLIGMI